MPTLPNFEALGERPVPRPTQAQPVGVAPRSNLGEEVSSAGRMVQSAAEVIQHTNMRQDELVAQDAVNKLQEARLRLQFDPQGFASVTGKAAVGADFQTKYSTQFDQTRDAIAGTLSGQQQQMFAAKAGAVKLHFLGSLLEHQSKATNAFNEQTENDTINNARTDILTNYTNPAAFQSGLNQVDWAVYQKAQRKAWDQQTTDRVMREQKQSIYQDVGSLMTENDPYNASALLEKRIKGEASGNQVIDGLDATHIVRLKNHADLRIRQIEADLARQTVDAEKRAREALTGLRTFMIEGRAPDDNYQKDVRAAVAPFPELRAMAEEYISMATKGASFGAQTLPRQQAILTQMESEPTNPETAKLVAHARSVFTTQSAAAKANPWEAGSRFWRLPVVPEVQIADAGQLPQLVSQRKPLMGSLETSTGTTVSPLQPNEARQVADALSNTPIPQRTQILGDVGEMLKDNPARVETLAAQLGERDRVLDLTLKLAAEKTGAGRMVAEIVQRGAQAISDKTVKKDDTALAGWRAEISDLVRGSGLPPKAEQDIIDSAYYVRAAQELANVAAPGYSNIGSGAKAAIAMVAGFPLERAGVKFLIPRGMTESEFDTKVQAALKPMAGQTFYVRGQPVTADSVAFRVGSFGMRMFQGGYVPVSNNAPLTIDKEGRQPLVLGVR